MIYMILAQVLMWIFLRSFFITSRTDSATFIICLRVWVVISLYLCCLTFMSLYNNQVTLRNVLDYVGYETKTDQPESAKIHILRVCFQIFNLFFVFYVYFIDVMTIVFIMTVSVLTREAVLGAASFMNLQHHNVIRNFAKMKVGSIYFKTGI